MVPLVDGMDLMFTPEGCEKRTFRFWKTVSGDPAFSGDVAGARTGLDGLAELTEGVGKAAAAEGEGAGFGVLGPSCVGDAGGKAVCVDGAEGEGAGCGVLGPSCVGDAGGKAVCVDGAEGEGAGLGVLGPFCVGDAGATAGADAGD
jgi:hypothetical protein